MKTNFVVLCVLFFAGSSRSQSPDERKAEPKERANTFSIYGGMGVALAAAPSMVDYLNTLADPSQRVQDFATIVEFFGGAELPVSENWAGGVEYSYLFKSYTLPTGGAGTYTIYYDLKMPTATAHYVSSGKGYFLKVGGGIGYHSGSIEQKSSFYGTDTTYTTHGVGVKVDAVGQTAFDDHLYGYIGAAMRWELMGSLKDSRGDRLQNQGQSASLSMFVVGLAFGLTYYF